MSRAPDRRRKTPHAPVPSHQFLDGEPILNEVRPSALGLALWQRYRDVSLWAGAPRERRFGLFAAQGAEPLIPLFTLETAGEPELRPALRTFALLTVHPEATDGETVALMCVNVSEWAFTRGWLGTGQLFAELAYAANPLDPDNSRIAGRACRRCALYERGEQWFRVSLALSRRARDAQGATLALIWWGTLEEQRARYRVAKKLYASAWQSANRANLRLLKAYTRHDLLVLTISGGSLDEGMAHAKSALAGYAPGEQRLPHLAHDTAVLWMMHGYFSAALPLLEAALPHISSPDERLKVLSSIARAAAGSRDADRFFEAWNEAEPLLRIERSSAAASLVNLARGARSLGYAQRAQQLATEAHQTATRRGERQMAEDAEKLMDRAAPHPVDEDRRPPNEVSEFAAEILALIEARSSGTRRNQPPDPNP